MDYTNERRETDTRRVREAVAVLRKHFDNVQVFVNYDEGGSQTRCVEYGAGNIFARVEHVRCWMTSMCGPAQVNHH